MVWRELMGRRRRARAENGDGRLERQGLQRTFSFLISVAIFHHLISYVPGTRRAALKLPSLVTLTFSS